MKETILTIFLVASAIQFCVSVSLYVNNEYQKSKLTYKGDNNYGIEKYKCYLGEYNEQFDINKVK